MSKTSFTMVPGKLYCGLSGTEYKGMECKVLTTELIKNDESFLVLHLWYAGTPNYQWVETVDKEHQLLFEEYSPLNELELDDVVEITSSGYEGLYHFAGLTSGENHVVRVFAGGRSSKTAKEYAILGFAPEFVKLVKNV